MSILVIHQELIFDILYCHILICMCFKHISEDTSRSMSNICNTLCEKNITKSHFQTIIFLPHSHISALCSPPIYFDCPRGSRIKWMVSTYYSNLYDILSINLCSQNNHNTGFEVFFSLL